MVNDIDIPGINDNVFECVFIICTGGDGGGGGGDCDRHRFGDKGFIICDTDDEYF